MRYKTTLIGPDHDHVASAMPTRYILVSGEKPKTRPLILSIKTSERKEGENLWIRKVGTLMGAAMLRPESQRAGLAISKLSGRARECKFTCNASVDATFPHGLRSRYRCIVCLHRLTRHIVCVHISQLLVRERKKYPSMSKS